MNMKTAMTVALTLGASAVSAEPDKAVSVTRVGTNPSTVGPSSNFTGAVRVDSRFSATAPATVGGGTVTFEPGARTAWHTHPLGQTLVVTAGVGLVQHWDGEIQEIRPGDIAWIPPGVKHWHGATATTGMSHIAISETLDGKSVEWLEHVTDEQYAR
ncbi:cupin domain-containing protein [Agrobacterium sp. AGB01]|uniref:(R)-mandelonitrile lyase n=1 Tax=Agrobacterium sp. AGB01 TaxID=2769302 RepID=UPI001781A4B7|nr:cupin domain-containing protein [Agrobacterium sp. AGB01]MBD9388437.1 cupin domain-containing protein [Agrobacterium sp. AGB01]